jgi:hypothetical protein
MEASAVRVAAIARVASGKLACNLLPIGCVAGEFFSALQSFQKGNTDMDSQDSSSSRSQGASERAAQAAQKAREFAASVVQQQKQRAASGLGQFSSAIRDTAGRLQDEKDATLAGYAEAAADHLDRAAGYVQASDPSTMLTDAQRFARRRPEIVVGGMFIAGVALARFLKAGASTAGDAGITEDTYVPHSKRPSETVQDSPELRETRLQPESLTFRSPRGQNASDRNRFNRTVEAAGGDMSPETFDKPERPDTNPENL